MLFDPSIKTYLLPNSTSTFIYCCHLDSILVAFKDQSTIAWNLFDCFLFFSEYHNFYFWLWYRVLIYSNKDTNSSWISTSPTIYMKISLSWKFCLFYWWSFIFHDYWLNHIFLISCNSTTNCSFSHLQWVLDCSLATCQNISRKQN